MAGSSGWLKWPLAATKPPATASSPIRASIAASVAGVRATSVIGCGSGSWAEGKSGSGRCPSRCFVYPTRSEEHTSELQSLMRISYAVFCLKKKTNYTAKKQDNINTITTTAEQHTTHNITH